tara:strand:+ start:2725 stop:3522 length:798 start_codon:yes stop_codon:yes gene_type:complete
MPLSIQIGADLRGIGGPSVAPSPRPSSGFNFSVDTRNFGISGSNEFSLPLQNGGTYNFDIAWGDGTTSTITGYNQPEIWHTYSVGGIYNIEITGTLIKWQMFFSNNDSQKILNVSNWGDLNVNGQWGFYGCTNMTCTATDAGANTGELYTCFYNMGYNSFTGGLTGWDMSNITDASYMLRGTRNYNEDVSGWDVSNITNMNSIFKDTSMTTANYDALLIAWAPQTVNSGVSFGIGSTQYTAGGAAAAARATLVSKGWTIADGGSV